MTDNTKAKTATTVQRGQISQEEQVVPMLKKEFSALSAVRKQYTDQQREFIRATLAPTLNDQELLLFIYRSQKLGLNPLNGECFAYASFETVNGKKVRKMVFIIGRGGKLRKAFETGHLKEIKTGAIYIKKTLVLKETGRAEANEDEIIKTVQPWEGGVLWGASCRIVRDDFQDAFVVTVPISEYRRNNTIWKLKPETMIKKVAESQCLSQAFPELASTYDEAEIWDNGSSQDRPLEIEDGDEPATQRQLGLIRSLGGKVGKQEDGVEIFYNRRQAANMIKELAQKKGKKT